MKETLHAAAVAPAAIGACCLVADRARVRAPELMASVLMLLAMLDAATVGALAPVAWTALLLAAAIALSAWRRPRRARSSVVSPAMTLHTSLGMVAMAALQLAMGGHSPVAGSSAAHAHGFDPAVLPVTAAAGYVALSAVWMRRMPTGLDRAQIAAMAASVALMGIAVV